MIFKCVKASKTLTFGKMYSGTENSCAYYVKGDDGVKRMYDKSRFEIKKTKTEPQDDTKVYEFEDKLPLGPRPKFILVQQRIQELCEAIIEYASFGKTAPKEWIYEVLELNEWNERKQGVIYTMPKE